MELEAALGDLQRQVEKLIDENEELRLDMLLDSRDETVHSEQPTDEELDAML